LTLDVAVAAAPVVAEPPPPPDTYLSRELRHIERERSGELSVVYVLNDNFPENMKHLTGLKNVFAKCLPNMPKPYIVRLLFDRRHRSVVIVRNDGTVIGGITYRPFYPQRFAEIAFCAIAQSLQVSGFGTRLMNWTKHYARLHDGCEYFLTYADNNAVGYFSKQGFTKSPTMPKDRVRGVMTCCLGACLS
jgi:histone acetyltransferase